MQTKKKAAERQERKPQRKGSEERLQIKHKEMDKEKVCCSVHVAECHVNACEDRRHRQALLVSPGSNRTFQRFQSIPPVFFPISTTFLDSSRYGLRCPDGCFTQSDRVGAGKGYVGPLIIFTLTLKFRFILLRDNPSSTVNRKKRGSCCWMQSPKDSDDQPFVSEASPRCKFFAHRRFPLLLILCSRQWSETRL